MYEVHPPTKLPDEQGGGIVLHPIKGVVTLICLSVDGRPMALNYTTPLGIAITAYPDYAFDDQELVAASALIQGF